MKDFCVVGSGISGSIIANLLSKKYTVEIFDKARGPGGRSSNRKYKNNLNFDHGLQYFNPESKEFKKFILVLKKKKILIEWLGQHLDFKFDKKEKSTKYIGKKGNNDICKYLIKNIRANYNSTVTNIKFNSNHWIITLNNNKKKKFKNLILTCPFPQTKLLVSNYIKREMSVLKVNMSPNITVMAAYKNYKKIPINSVKFNDDIVAWGAQENTKNRFKSSKILWTIQCTENYSKKIINSFKKNKKKYELIILKRFESLLGFKVKNIFFKNIHGWRYSYNKVATPKKSIFIDKINLGICGDWFIGPKAENSWQSAINLFNKIKIK